jgi:hypothetical protein
MRARAILRKELPNLELTVHAATNWDTDPDSLAACKADIAQGDIIFATMLFIEDHINAVLPDLEARREHCDAMVACMAAGEVVRLTRMGRFKMGGQESTAAEVHEEPARQQEDRLQRRREPNAHAAPPAEGSEASFPARRRICAPTS